MKKKAQKKTNDDDADKWRNQKATTATAATLEKQSNGAINANEKIAHRSKLAVGRFIWPAETGTSL